MFTKAQNGLERKEKTLYNHRNTARLFGSREMNKNLSYYGKELG